MLASICLVACSAEVPRTAEYLVASDGRSGDRLGFGVAVRGDTVVVGEPERQAIYVFARSGDAWMQEAKLTAVATEAGPEFGAAFGVDGVTLIVGAFGRDAYRGAAYVYTRSEGTWSVQDVLTAADGVAGDYFGSAVAVDGDTAIVAAKYSDGRRGSAHVFSRNGAAWTQVQEFTAEDAVPDLRFGYAIALQGDTAVITAPKPGDYRGVAYVFVRSNGTWAQQARLQAADGRDGDWFGSSVALDGDTAAIGAAGRDGTGAVYVFSRAGGVWTQRTVLTSTEAADGDRFGASVALSGTRLAASAPGNDDRAGTVVVFRGAGDSWAQESVLEAGDGAGATWFGYSVAMAGSTLAVGAPTALDNRGAALVYGALPPPANRPRPSSPAPKPGRRGASGL